MSRRLVTSMLAAAIAMAVLATPIAAAEASNAQQPFGVSRIEFVDPEPTAVPFGDPWFLELNVAWSYEGFNPLSTKDGTVTITISGTDGDFATGLPINPGGAVFVAQPDDKPLLAPGKYKVNATFVPAKGTFFPSAKTDESANLEITAVGVTPQAVLAEDPVTGADATITATISGDYVTAHDGPPAGTWHFSIAENAKAPLYEVEVAQPAGDITPITFGVPEPLAAGGTYTMTTSFTPAGEMVSGLTVAEIPTSTVTIAGGGFAGFVGSAIELPLPIAISLMVITLALAVTALVLFIRRPRAPSPSA